MSKVIHIIADGAPGGGTTIVMELLSGFQTLGHPTVLITEEGSMLETQMVSNGIKCHGLSFFGGIRSIKTILTLHKTLQSESPCRIHLHGSRATFFCLPSLIFKRASRTIYTIHGYHFANRSPLRKYLGICLEWLSSKFVDHLVFVSKRDLALANKYGLAKNTKIEFIPNGIDFNCLPSSRATKPKLIVFLGRLVPQKRPSLFLEIASLLAPLGFRFRIIGGGQLERQLRETAKECGIADKIEFCGVVSRDTAITQLSEAEVFVSTSLWEGLPLAPMEAMGIGVPCVLSDIPSHRELVEDLSGSFLINDSAENFAEAIDAISADKELQDNLSKSGKRHVLKYSSEVMKHAYFSLYSKENKRLA